VYTDYWKPMQEILKNNLTDFIRHYLNKSGFDVKQSEIYFATKERISKSDSLSYLKDLYIFAEYYARLLEPQRELNENIRKHLYRLNRLDIATVYPFLLNCYDDWVQSKITEEEFISILKIIENFLIRRFICNVQTRGLNRIFALLYSEVSKRSSLASDDFIKRLKLSLQSRNYPKDAEFKARLIDVKLYGGNRSEKTKLILESIEESFKHKEKVSFDELSIEHIMPQTLNEWWQKSLGEDWAITHELYLHSLGNLTLTAYNPELSNNDFLYKKTHYKNSHLELNKYFHHKEFWRREDIEARAEYLAERALQIWDYFGEEEVNPSESSILTGTTPKLLHIFGQEYSVKSWRDVLETTLNTLSDLEPEKFKEIMQQFPRFIGIDEKDFRSTRKLKNGVFIEVNLSAKDIGAFCRKAIETTELSSEEWYVETVT
ncbi:HNH endonuclease, partial [Trichormus variabilis FSR]